MKIKFVIIFLRSMSILCQPKKHWYNLSYTRHTVYRDIKGCQNIMIFGQNQRQRDNDGVAAHMGPQSFADKENPERMFYAGSSLRRFPYYAPSVCLAYLKTLAGHSITLHEATERQFMEALEST